MLLHLHSNRIKSITMKIKMDKKTEMATERNAKTSTEMNTDRSRKATMSSSRTMAVRSTEMRSSNKSIEQSSTFSPNNCIRLTLRKQISYNKSAYSV